MSEQAASNCPIVCEAVIGNLSAMPAGRLTGKSPDALSLTWMDCTRRAFRKTTTGGRAISLLLPPGTTLSHQDVIHEEEAAYVVIDVRPCDLWLVTTSNAAAMTRVALELGNLHVPVEVMQTGELLTPPDGPTEGVLRRNGVSYVSCHRRFVPLRATVTSGFSVAKGLKVGRGKIALTDEQTRVKPVLRPLQDLQQR